MADVYQLNLAGLVGLCGVLFLSQSQLRKASSEQDGSDQKKTNEEKSGDGKAAAGSDGSQWPFLVVYSLVMGSDWLQGPFLYSLYRDEHGVPASLVSTLFTTGFLAGAAGGYFAGSVADRRGRKRACLFFCACYAASCALTTLPSVPLLFAGRVLGGVGTSLLFSVFESWMVTDFHARGLAAKGGDLSRTFGLMGTLNSVVAIVSGVFSEWLVAVTGTRKAPFVASILLLAAAFWLISTRWAENYGESGKQSKKDVKKDDDDASKPKTIIDNRNKLSYILTDPRIVVLGLASTMFEGSMYLFVFYWSPALNAVKSSLSSSSLPYGIIFASFMASTMASSLLFNVAMSRQLLRYTSLMIGILALSSLSLVVLAEPRAEQVTFWLFCVFEACVGAYWPCMGYLKGRLIEDGARARVYSVLRVPLNLFVVASLMLSGDEAAYASVFSVCSKLLLVSCGGIAVMLINEENVP